MFVDSTGTVVKDDEVDRLRKPVLQAVSRLNRIGRTDPANRVAEPPAGKLGQAFS